MSIYIAYDWYWVITKINPLTFNWQEKILREWLTNTNPSKNRGELRWKLGRSVFFQQHFCLYSYVRGLAFYSQVENTFMTPSFQKKKRCLVPENYFYTAIFLLHRVKKESGHIYAYARYTFCPFQRFYVFASILILLGEDYNQGNRLTFHLSELKNMYLWSELIKVPRGQTPQSSGRPRYVGRGDPLDEGLSGYNMEILTVDHIG